MRLNASRKIIRIGNSVGVILPKSFVDVLGVRAGMQANFVLNENRQVVMWITEIPESEPVV